MVNERAISIHFRQLKNRPDVVVDQRTGKEYPRDEVETGVLVYEDQVTGWFFDFAQKLKGEHNAGFVVLQIAVAQIEGMEQYRRGESSEPKKSGLFFGEALKRIFPSVKSKDDWPGQFYKAVRCGLFHDGLTRQSVDVSPDFPEPLVYVRGRICVNPNRFLDAVMKEFRNYLARLRNPAETELRDAFYRLWPGAV